MTKLLEQAITTVRDLPEEDQEAIAAVMLSMAGLMRPSSSSIRRQKLQSEKEWHKPNAANSCRTRSWPNPTNVMAYEGSVYAARLCRSRGDF